MDKLIAEGIKVDLTVTSPPYDNLRSYNGNNVLWNEDVWKQAIQQLYKITKDGGVVVWVVGDSTVRGSETGTSFKQALYFKEIGFNLHDTMIYAKNNPIPLTHNRYEQQFEYMFIFSKGKPKSFNALLKENKTAGRKQAGTFRQSSGELQKRHKEGAVKKHSYRNNIWYYSVGKKKSTTDRIAFKHPAIFPEKLAKEHIVSWSNENDIVFDPFMGSGTTGKMALLNNRKFIGIELDEKYFNIAKERIEEVKNDSD